MKRLSNIQESIWSNIYKRSEGNLDRKENSVDGLSYMEFYEYLQKIYTNLGYKCKYDTSYKIEYIDEKPYNCFKISIPIEMNGDGWTESLIVEYDSNTGDCMHISINSSLTFNYSNINDVLKDKFKIKYEKFGSWDTIKKINGSPITNSDVIWLIDKLFGMVRKPLFKKNDELI